MFNPSITECVLVNLNFMPTSASAPKHVLDFFLNELKLYPAGRHGDRLFRRHV
jgi:hypothetical protein